MWVSISMVLIPASQLDIRAYVYEYVGLNGHGFRLCIVVCCVFCANMLRYYVIVCYKLRELYTWKNVYRKR